MKTLEIGDVGVDYNGTKSVVINILSKFKAIQEVSKLTHVPANELLHEVAELKDDELIYITKCIEENDNVPVEEGAIGFYPVVAARHFYWELNEIE